MGLFWGSCTDSALFFSWIIILNTFLLWNQFHLPINPNLPIKRLSIQTQGRFWITPQLFRLFTSVISIKYKTSFIKCLQEHNSYIWISIYIACCKVHLIPEFYSLFLKSFYFLKPIMEYFKWINLYSFFRNFNFLLLINFCV